MKKILKRIISVVFPAACLACRGDLRPGDRPGLCGHCWDSTTPIKPPFCQRCGLPLPDGGAHCFHCRRTGGALKIIRSAALYQSPLKEALKRFKYQRKGYLAPALGELLFRAAGENPGILHCAYVIPVPAHPRKQRQRGYNQSELLAKEFCKRTGQTLEVSWLKTTRNRRSQTELSRKERFKNVEGGFELRLPTPQPKGDVLLIDDICTTGATLEECAKTLKKAGFRRILALTVARETPGRRP